MNGRGGAQRSWPSTLCTSKTFWNSFAQTGSTENSTRWSLLFFSYDRKRFEYISFPFCLLKLGFLAVQIYHTKISTKITCIFHKTTYLNNRNKKMLGCICRQNTFFVNEWSKTKLILPQAVFFFVFVFSCEKNKDVELVRPVSVSTELFDSPDKDVWRIHRHEDQSWPKCCWSDAHICPLTGRIYD